MDWTEQTNQLMKTWSDAQKQLMTGWMDWAQGAGFGQAGLPAFDPSQFLRMGVDAWSGLRESSAQRVAGNLFGTPELVSRSMNLIMKAWQVAAPKIEQGKPWQPDLQKMLEQWRNEAVNLPQRATAMTSEFAQLTKSVFERWSPVTAPWLSMVSQAATQGHPAAAFLSGTSGLNNLLGFGEAFQMMSGYGQQGLSELPRATVAREKMGKILRAIDTLSDLQEAQRAYHGKLADGIASSIERTVEHLAKLAEKGEKITSARDLMRTYFSIADRTLLEVFNTPEFLEIQDKLTAALMRHKTAQREALEIVYNSLEIPTRTEIDEAYRDIHELKKEVRALRKALQEATADRSAASPSLPPTPSSVRIGKRAAKEPETTEASAS